VITRIKRKDGQGDLFTGEAYTYRGILTNDMESSNQEVVAFYNARGESERVFDAMNNDYGWSNMPCSFRKHRLHDHDGHLCEFLHLCDQGIPQETLLAERELQDQEVHLPLHHRCREMDQDRGQEVLKLFTGKDYRPILD